MAEARWAIWYSRPPGRIRLSVSGQCRMQAVWQACLPWISTGPWDLEAASRHAIQRWQIEHGQSNALRSEVWPNSISLPDNYRAINDIVKYLSSKTRPLTCKSPVGWIPEKITRSECLVCAGLEIFLVVYRRVCRLTRPRAEDMAVSLLEFTVNIYAQPHPFQSTIAFVSRREKDGLFPTTTVIDTSTWSSQDSRYGRRNRAGDARSRIRFLRRNKYLHPGRPRYGTKRMNSKWWYWSLCSLQNLSLIIFFSWRTLLCRSLWAS